MRGATECWTDRFSGDDLVAACQRGEREAQRLLYEEHRGRVYSLMVRMVGTEDAADLTQQVILQVLRTIRQFSGRSQLSTWIYRLAVNEALQHLRKKRKSKLHSLQCDAVDGSPACTRQTEEAELLEQALARLDPELRSIFLLREVEGLPYQEIAASLDISEGTVGSRLNRARKQLRIHLVDLGWQP
jgi:RNA polymerase sigma-70 factor (ECF subfamily)